MREVVWSPRGLGGAPVYTMLTDNPIEAISWPTSPRYLVAAAPANGAAPIGPDELAALVAARTGGPIRVVA